MNYNSIFKELELDIKSASKRKTEKKKLFRSVIRRDGLNCHLCGIDLNKSIITLDHIIPLSKGGKKWSSSNIKLSCKICNNNRSNLPVDYFKMLQFYYKINKNLELKIMQKGRLVRVGTLDTDVFKHGKKG